jgi:hypothetical protein
MSRFLTGGALVSYLLRLLEDIVNRNPRFKQTLGTVSYPNNVTIRWNDVEVLIRSVASAGNRLSPNNFMFTQTGRAVVCQIADKEGLFIEDARETDKTRTNPPAGVYYINVDYFDDATRTLGLTIQTYRWVQGKLSNAQGSIVYFRVGIDPTNLKGVEAETGKSIQFTPYNYSLGSFAYLITPVQTLTLYYPDGTPLQPMVDFWYQRNQSAVLIQNTLGGQELANLPAPCVTFTLTDQDGYVLRPNVDFTMQGFQWVQLSSFTPSGSTITANMVVKLNPYTTTGTNPENILPINVMGSESLAAGEVFICTPSGNFPNAVVDQNGTISLPTLLQPGDWLRWDIRINSGQLKAMAKKWEWNSCVIVDPNSITFSTPSQVAGQPAPAPTPVQTSAGTPLLKDGLQQYVFPGLLLAIGDKVVVGDQQAVIVSPVVTETYHVYGSKENVNIILEVKANDLQTASDLSEMIKEQFLVKRRMNTEADGLAIFEVSSDFIGEQRDQSATAPTYKYNLSISASADWKAFVPLVTRLVQIEVNAVASIPDFPSKPVLSTKMRSLGITQFLTPYE